MADRKSSDNELLTELSDNDLFDVLDADEGVASNKNKSMTKQALFTQINNELGLTSDSGRITDFSAQNGWLKGASSYYRKLGQTVFLNIQMNPSSAGNITCMTLPAGYRPTKLTACAVTFLSALANAHAVAYITSAGEVKVVQAGTTGTIPSGSIAYQIMCAFDV